MDYVFFAGVAAGTYALCQLSGYCVQSGRFYAAYPGKAAEKAKSLLLHTDGALERILFFGERRAAKSYLNARFNCFQY